jgi:hypothetical protein
MLSPYSQLCPDFFENLNQYFTNLFQLAPTYKYEGIVEGDRYGIITVRSLEPNTDDRQADKEVRGGFQFLVARLEILMTMGAGDRISAEALALSTALDLHHGIPALKQFFSAGLVYDLKTYSDITSVKRQALKPPNNWIVDVTCRGVANICIYVDINGQHLMK